MLFYSPTAQSWQAPDLTFPLSLPLSPSGAEGGYAQAVTSALRDLYSSMENVASVPPIIMLNVLHTAFPRFAERAEQGGFQQQVSGGRTRGGGGDVWGGGITE